MNQKKSEPHELKFEDALERLETIANDMESGNLSLENMMAYFEEGMRLVKTCSEQLNQYEQRIEVLTKKGEETVAEPFDVEGEGPYLPSTPS